jgi:hypothetical protein
MEKLGTEGHHANPYDVVHGGVIATLLDQVLSIEVWRAARKVPCSTVQLDTHFVSHALPGDLLEVRAAISLRALFSASFRGLFLQQAGPWRQLASGVWKIAGDSAAGRRPD